MKLFIYIFSIVIVFCNDEIIHINKVYPDGSPREIIIYWQAKPDLKSDGPLQVVDRIMYDSKGNYIRPPLSRRAKDLKKSLIGRWEDISANQGEKYTIQIKRDESFILYENADNNIVDRGKVFIEEDIASGQIFITRELEGSNRTVKGLIIFNNKNEFEVFYYDSAVDTAEDWPYDSIEGSIDTSNMVFFDSRYYYLDGSGGKCIEGFELAPQNILNDIATSFTGLTYYSTVSDNCCISHAAQESEGQDWGMGHTDWDDDKCHSCNEPGRFICGPKFGGAGCEDSENSNLAQLTLCKSSIVKSVFKRIN